MVATRLRRLLVPALVALPVLALLIGLGTWQVQRLQWKTELLARFAEVEAAPPIPLTEAPPPFAKVVATGRFDHDREALLGLEVRGTTLGAHLIVPLLREGRPPLLVDRGWVPLERSTPILRPEGEVSVTGWVRPPEQAGMFSATDDPVGRRFYTFDPQTLGAGLGLPEVAPFGLVALGPPGRELPQPARGLPQPNNPHLGYAITWYGLALALVAVFIAWVLRPERAAPPIVPPEDPNDRRRL